MPAEGGEPKKVTFDSAGDRSPAFSADGKKLYFIRSEGGDFAGGERPQSNLMVVLLEKQEKDPYETSTPDDSADNSSDVAQRRFAGAGRGGNDGVTNRKAPTVDWAGLKRRTRNVLRPAGGTGGGRGGRGGGGGGAAGGMSVTTFTPARDGRTIV